MLFFPSFNSFPNVGPATFTCKLNLEEKERFKAGKKKSEDSENFDILSQNFLVMVVYFRLQSNYPCVSFAYQQYIYIHTHTQFLHR